MHITVVYGTERQGCSWHVARGVLDALPGARVQEFALPEALPKYCLSCFACFTGARGTCAHSRHTAPLREALVGADCIILASPVYSYYVSGAMKNFLDHFANIWMVHRPEASMFTKQGVVIATASGPVCRRALNEMGDSLTMWGISSVHRLGAAMFHTQWEEVSPAVKRRIDKKARRIARRIAAGPVRRPSLRVWLWFHISRMMQKNGKMNPADVAYWERMGWTGRGRPWKS